MIKTKTFDGPKFKCGHPHIPENTRQHSKHHPEICRICDMVRINKYNSARAARKKMGVRREKNFRCGHPQSFENTLIDTEGYTRCRQCRNETQQKSWLKRHGGIRQRIRKTRVEKTATSR